MNALIIQSANQLRKTLQLTFKQHNKLYLNWERHTHNDEIRDKEIKQYCPVCGEKVKYNPRYPKEICSECKKKITDETGRKVAFENYYGFGHGCRGRYLDTMEFYESNICYINNIKLEADEHHFGGIVIQKSDD